ncbi:hypothetical protein ElyMa_006843500 [Elysia marginata]|uniref:Uncharacterized protein n=1 Tax=Elysia marginata TaxID=1093978 RepID=A0AAV4J7A5_9GAST|nr:hypothetical protein ElyMa_006843500 [Elysia marginata]
MAKATIAMAKCADKLAQRADYKGKFTSLTDAMTLLGHTQKSITNLRRKLMRYALPYDFKSLCDASPTLLYGDDIIQNFKGDTEFLKSFIVKVHRNVTAAGFKVSPGEGIFSKEHASVYRAKYLACISRHAREQVCGQVCAWIGVCLVCLWVLEHPSFC